MSERWYLVDNNALSRLTSEQRRGPFFRKWCQVTSDVLYEARGFAEAELAELERPVTPGVFARLIEVMATLQPGDTNLVDLYANKGAADPVMVACALEARDFESQTLLPDTWVIVTDDKAVTNTAHRFGLEVLSSHDFRALLLSEARFVVHGSAHVSKQ